MDAAAVLENYVTDVSTLPSEFACALEELRDLDLKFYEVRKRIQQKDAQIHKFIKTHGSLAHNPKESQLYPKMRADFERAITLQEEKIDVANAGLYILSRNVKKLNDEIAKLEEEGLLPPPQAGGVAAVAGGEMAYDSAYLSEDMVAAPGPPTARARTSARPSGVLVDRKRSPGPSRGSTPGGRPTKRQKLETEVVGTPPTPRTGTRPSHNANNEEEDVYCVCQQVSFGMMVACDNPDCQYEWFHIDCVGLKEPPVGTWYCPTCAREKKEEKRRRG